MLFPQQIDALPSPEERLAQLVAEERRGERHKFVFFWKERTAEPGCLSQFWASRFAIDGETYRSAEQWMMASKASLFGDAEARRRIMLAKTPAEMKAIGRNVRSFDETQWAARRYQLVMRGNLAKFEQNADLRMLLVATKHRVLAEASRLDRVWGIGLDSVDTKATRPSQWRGLNLLGFALMSVREALTR